MEGVEGVRRGTKGNKQREHQHQHCIITLLFLTVLPPSLSLSLSPLPPNRHHPSIGFINTVCGIVVIAVQMLGFNRMQKRVGKHATASIGLLLFGVGNALVPIFPMVLVGLTPGAGAFNATTDGAGNSSGSSNSNGMRAGGNSSALG